MAVHKCWFIVAFLVVCVCSSKADDNADLIRRLDATEELVKTLSHRVDVLEAREKIHLQRIDDLESNDNQQQETIEELKHQLQEYSQLFESHSEAESTVDSMRTNDEQNSIEQKHNKRDNAVPIIRQANVESPVAFLALLSRHITHAGVNQVIVFDKVVTNVGNGYNAAVGIFTAPVEGIYVFSATLTEYSTGNAAHYSFYHNSTRINFMYVNTNGGESAGSTITLHLQQGDVVTVRNDDADDAVNGDVHSSFTGFLLTSYDSVQPIIGK